MYNWLRQTYENRMVEELRDAIDFGEMTEDEADQKYDELMEDWGAGYGDYMYSLRGDR